MALQRSINETLLINELLPRRHHQISAIGEEHFISNGSIFNLISEIRGIASNAHHLKSVACDITV